MNTSKTKGVNGEIIAKNHLIKEGYEILKTNFHSQFGEIDIVAYKERITVFVEVKNYKRKSLINPLTKINNKKQENLIKTAKYYMYKENKEMECRFDAIILENNHVKKHLQNIIQLS